jgi:hypothetical protein
MLLCLLRAACLPAVPCLYPPAVRLYGRPGTAGRGTAGSGERVAKGGCFLGYWPRFQKSQRC